jgi:hypothetical protein
MKILEWGVIPTRSACAKKSGTDGHLGFFTYSTGGDVCPGETRTPVVKSAAAARQALKDLIKKFGLNIPRGL